MKPNPETLSEPSAFSRSLASRGLKPRRNQPAGVDRTSGRYGAGVIRGVSVLTRGEAGGHKLWIDAEALRQTAAAINDAKPGVKSRFTHPGLSGDGLGTALGRVYGPAEVIGGQVIADLHFYESAHTTPEGDLAGYAMDLAEEDPKAFGASIVFAHDVDAEEEFEAAHSAGGEFRSPDPENVNHYRHIRIKELRAVDAVDDPAANPAGLFSRGQDIALTAEALAEYVFGLSDECPEVSFLAIDVPALAAHVNQFMSDRGLTIGPRGEPAPEEPAERFADASGLMQPAAGADQPARFADVAELARPFTSIVTIRR